MYCAKVPVWMREHHMLHVNGKPEILYDKFNFESRRTPPLLELSTGLFHLVTLRVSGRVHAQIWLASWKCYQWLVMMYCNLIRYSIRSPAPNACGVVSCFFHPLVCITMHNLHSLHRKLQNGKRWWFKGGLVSSQMLTLRTRRHNRSWWYLQVNRSLTTEEMLW